MNNSITGELRRIKTKPLLFSPTSLLLNQSEMSTVEVFEVPDKSENDKKSYRVIRLINGLKVLLISTSTQSIPTEQLINSTNVEDENESDNKLAACSLCVDVGSFSNPRDIQGLAHFLGKIDVNIL